MSTDEEGEIKPEREKTDGGRVLIQEARQEEGVPKAIKRVALVPPKQTIDRNSIMDGIIETMQHFVRDEMGAAYAQFITILDTLPLSMDNTMIINGQDGTIHRAVEISHTDADVMRMFNAMVEARNPQGGIDILGVPLHFVFPIRGKEMAAEVIGSVPHAQHTFTPTYVIEASGLGTGLSDKKKEPGRDRRHRERGIWWPEDRDVHEMQPQR